MLLVLIIFRENFDPLAIPENFIFVFAAISFIVEYMLMDEGIADLGSVVYGLMGGLTLACAACCLYLSIRPVAFFAEFLLSSGLVFKGTWALQIGLSLYTGTFGLKGCDKISMSPAQGKTDFKCDLQDDKLRAIALVNLLFVGHATAILVTGFVLFGLLSRHSSLRCGEASGPLLAGLESESLQMRPIPEFELE